MRRLLGVLLLVPFLSGLGGCSVAMALSSEKTPDLTVLTAGADRVEIEEALGEPIRVEPIAGTDEVIVTYEYTEGKKADPLRALAHGFFDALTLGLWELAGVPIEMAVSQAIARGMATTRQLRRDAQGRSSRVANLVAGALQKVNQ